MMQKYINKKYVVIFLLTFCLCLIFLSVYLYKASNEDIDKAEVYGDFLSRVVEEQFMGEDEIILAEAEVSYDRRRKQYSIELALTADKEISEEKIEFYKTILKKTCAESVLSINGEVK